MDLDDYLMGLLLLANELVSYHDSPICSNLPNKGAGRTSKVRSDRFREKLSFAAF